VLNSQQNTIVTNDIINDEKNSSTFEVSTHCYGRSPDHATLLHIMDRTKNRMGIHTYVSEPSKCTVFPNVVMPRLWQQRRSRINGGNKDAAELIINYGENGNNQSQYGMQQ
jgi:hypothetical protein